MWAIVRLVWPSAAEQMAIVRLVWPSAAVKPLIFSFIESINKLHWLAALGLWNVQDRSAKQRIFKLNVLHTVQLSLTH
jgi:hypothetical protein